MGCDGGVGHGGPGHRGEESHPSRRARKRRVVGTDCVYHTPPPKRYRWEAGQPGEGLQVVFSNAIQKLMTSAASGGHDLGRKAIVNEVSRWCRQLSRAACESGTSACDCREHSLTVRA